MTIKDSIRKNLLVSYIILSIVPLLLLGSVLSWQSYVVQKKMAQDLHTEISRQSLKEILNVIKHLEEDLKITAKFTKLLKQDRENQIIVLSKLLTHKGRIHNKIINEISLIDSMGSEQIRLSKSAVFTPDDLRQRSDAEEFKFPSTRRETYFIQLYYRII